MNDIIKKAKAIKGQKQPVISEKPDIEIQRAMLRADAILLGLDEEIIKNAKSGYLNLCPVKDYYGYPSNIRNTKKNYIIVKDNSYCKTSSELALFEDTVEFWVWQKLSSDGYEPELNSWHDGVGINSGVDIVLRW